MKDIKIVRGIFLAMLVLSLAFVLVRAEAGLNGPYYYDIELYYDKGNIEIKNIKIEFFNDEKFNFNKNNSHYLEIIDNEQRVLDEIFFSIPNVFLGDAANESEDFAEGRIEVLENVSFNVFADYYENGYQIIIYKNDKNKKELDREFISQFSKTGFNIEDFRKKGIEKTEEEIISEREDREKRIDNVNYQNFIPTLGIILLILIIILVYFLRKRK
ncbi:MAG: hypothetical protein AABX77_03450 [Nanoarchaeota archaeon]